MKGKRDLAAGEGGSRWRSHPSWSGHSAYARNATQTSQQPSRRCRLHLPEGTRLREAGVLASGKPGITVGPTASVETWQHLVAQGVGGHGCRGDHCGGSSKPGSLRLATVEEEKEAGRSPWGCPVPSVAGWPRWAMYGAHTHTAGAPHEVPEALRDHREGWAWRPGCVASTWRLLAPSSPPAGA